MELSEIFAALRWWITLLVLGLAATPLIFALFRKLPDRGYAFVKTAGLLLTGYLFWILGSIGFLSNGLGSILVALGLVVAVSIWVYQHQQRAHDDVSLGEWLRENRSQVLLTELVFGLLFVLWIWVRSQNPAIQATEKPMEFAFLNAVGRTPTFPPHDPWLSGFGISYYYFGYIMTSVVSQLAHVAEPLAFNLAIAWLVAATGTGSFGLIYNLLSAQEARKIGRILGLVAALAIPLAGNLVIGLELANANGVGSPAFWEWLDVRDLQEPGDANTTARYETSNWWWWRSSRPIREYHLSGRAEDGLEPIAEFPAFSFVLGDLHPHVLALPVALLAMALALVWWLPNRGRAHEPPRTGARTWTDAAREKWLASFPTNVPLPLWLFSAVVLGGLSFLNTWDVLIYLFLLLGAFLLARWRDQGWQISILWQSLALGVLLLVPIFLLYLPFFLGFRSQAGAPFLLPMLMRPTRLIQFLLIFGMPLWAIAVMLVTLIIKQHLRHWRTGLAAALVLVLSLMLLTILFGLIVAASPEGAGRVTGLANELGITLAPRPEQGFALGWGTAALLAILPEYLYSRLANPAMILFLALVIGSVIMIWLERLRTFTAGEGQRTSDVLPFALLLIFTAALLVIGPEFLYLRDNFGVRLNTVFKFYYQAWLMFGVSGLFAIGYLWKAWPASGKVAAVVAAGGYFAAFLVAMLFPIYAVSSRAMEYRGPATAETRRPASLNGLRYINAYDSNEYDALMWLRDNVPGTPVILEAVGGQYSNYGRVSAATGLPTVLGWPGHEYQWRGDTSEPALREPIVKQIYSQPDLPSVAGLLNEYDVEYIYVGNLERESYGLAGLDKFEENLQVAYSNGSVTIYRWQPQG